jgi:drug/metabolite transporter (DMT)-like permease
VSRLRADILLLVAAVVWGTAFYFQKRAMAHVGPLMFLTIRAAISAIALLPLAIHERIKTTSPLRAMLPVTMFAALAFLLGGGLQQAGLQSATVTNASFLTALYVVIVPLLVWVLQGQAPSPAVWIGVALSFAGSWLLGGGTVGGFRPGDWMILVSTLAWAAHILLTQKAGTHDQPFTFTSLQFAMVAAIGLPSALATESNGLVGIGLALPSLLFVGILSGAMGFGILAVTLRHAPAAEATIIMSLEMVFASAAGYVLLGERLTLPGWIGGAMILAAALVVQLGQLIKPAPQAQS